MSVSVSVSVSMSVSVSVSMSACLCVCSIHTHFYILWEWEIESEKDCGRLRVPVSSDSNQCECLQTVNLLLSNSESKGWFSLLFLDNLRQVVWRSTLGHNAGSKDVGTNQNVWRKAGHDLTPLVQQKIWPRRTGVAGLSFWHDSNHRKFQWQLIL